MKNVCVFLYLIDAPSQCQRQQATKLRKTASRRRITNKTKKEGMGAERGRGVLTIMHSIAIRPQTSHPYRSWDGARRVFCKTRLALLHQARSAVLCSASRVEGELHLAKIIRPDTY